jgi:hypothetical protein
LHEHRLRDTLQAFGDDACWQPFEAALNRHIVRTFGLADPQVHIARFDSTAWQILSDGGVHIGQARGWRAGAVRLPVTHAAFGATGVPLVTLAAPRRDVARTLAAIQQVRVALHGRLLLFSGEDVGALEARATIHHVGDTYLARLAGWPVQTTPGERASEIRPLQFAPADAAADIAEGYEWDEPTAGLAEGRLVEWRERRLLVRSRGQVRSAEEELAGRLARAGAALADLGERRRGKRRPRTREAFEQAVQEVVESYQVGGLLSIEYVEVVAERMVRRYRGRPTAMRVERDVQVRAMTDEAALAHTRSQFGWQLYATNLARDTAWVSPSLLAGGDLAGFERLSGRPISLTSAALSRDDLATGLARLLSLALRAVTLVELLAHRQIEAEGSLTASLGDRRRSAGSAADRLLDAFRDIALADAANETLVTPLNPLQQRVLHTLGLPQGIYQYRAP